MKEEIRVRCYAKKHKDVWVAACADLNLVTQGSTCAEATNFLDLQISDYIKDILPDGIDHEFAEQLLSRKSYRHISLYYWYSFVLSASNTLSKVKPLQFHKLSGTVFDVPFRQVLA